MLPQVAPTIEHRHDEEIDWSVRQFFTPADLQLEPEEYVARHAHVIGNFAFHLYRFADPSLGVWVRRVGELLDSAEEVKRCRERFLSAEEIARAQQQAAEGLQTGACRPRSTLSYSQRQPHWPLTITRMD